jgi:hypothetical protein
MVSFSYLSRMRPWSTRASACKHAFSDFMKPSSGLDVFFHCNVSYNQFISVLNPCIFQSFTPIRPEVFFGEPSCHAALDRSLCLLLVCILFSSAVHSNARVRPVTIYFEEIWVTLFF